MAITKETTNCNYLDNVYDDDALYGNVPSHGKSVLATRMISVLFMSGSHKSMGVVNSCLDEGKNTRCDGRIVNRKKVLLGRSR